MRVFAPNSSSSVDHEELIKSFFKTRRCEGVEICVVVSVVMFCVDRLLNEGDVFCVPLVGKHSIRECSELCAVVYWCVGSDTVHVVNCCRLLSCTNL